METLINLIEYLIYSMIAVIAIFVPVLFYCKYQEAKFAKQWADTINKEFKVKESALIKEAQKWEKLATAPMMPDPNPPIIIHKSDLQKVVIRTELDKFPIMREKAIREGVDKLGDFIAPLVYSEIKEDEYGRKVLHQEIWVGLSEKFNNKKS